MSTMAFDQKELYRRLRSGTILKGYNRLARKNGCRCILGVICDMAVEAGITVLKDTEYGLAYITPSRPDGETGMLPPEVVKWAGLRDSWGSAANWELPYLTDLNDNETLLSGRVKTFADMADWLEANESQYFHKEAA